MAPWIAHLRLAEDLLQRISGLDPAYFAIGSVAPDSGIPDENYETFDPPVRISHFHAPQGSRYAIADLEFFRDTHVDALTTDNCRQEFSFYLGYFFHLVTDNLWLEEIDKPTRARFKAQFKADPKFIWEVKRDWYGLDLEFVRNNKESFFWTVFLDTQYDQDFLSYMPPRAIKMRIEGIKELYQRNDAEIEEWYGRRPDKYLSREEYDRFVTDNTQRLNHAYEALVLEKIPILDRLSVLELGI